MARDTTSSNTLPIGQVFKSSGMLVYKHILFWIILAVVVHYVSWKFVTEILGYIIEHIFNIGTEVNEPLKIILIAIGSSILLQMIASQLIYAQLVRCEKKIGIGDIFQLFQTTNFGFNLLRCIGITMVHIGIFLASFIPFMILLLAEIDSIFIISLTFIIFFVLYAFIINRFSLAVPVVVVEDKKILESLKRSWQMTASCWIRVFVVFFLIGVMVSPILGGVLVLAFVFDFNDVSFFKALNRISTMILSFLSAVVVSVCYCYLQSAEDRDNNPPKSKA